MLVQFPAWPTSPEQKYKKFPRFSFYYLLNLLVSFVFGYGMWIYIGNEIQIYKFMTLGFIGLNYFYNGSSAHQWKNHLTSILSFLR